MSTYITATERAYREVSTPSTPRAKKISTTEKRQPKVTRAEIDDILQGKRSRSPEALQYAIDHAKEFRLRDHQVDKIRVLLTVELAAKSRQAHGEHWQFIRLAIAKSCYWIASSSGGDRMKTSFVRRRFLAFALTPKGDKLYNVVSLESFRKEWPLPPENKVIYPSSGEKPLIRLVSYA